MAKLYFKYGTMNSGKSLQLLATAHNFTERGVPHILLKSAIDNRTNVNEIQSRAIGSRECVPIDSDSNIYEAICNLITQQDLYLMPRLQWILIDESQFLSKQHIDDLGRIVDNHNINVMCFGIKTDFKGDLFDGSKRLFEIADTFEEIKTTCSCGNKNLFNARFDKDGDIATEGVQIEIGAEDTYLSMCRKCYNNKTKFFNKV